MDSYTDAICLTAWVLAQTMAVIGFGGSWSTQFARNGEILPDEDFIVRNISDLPNDTLSLFCSITEDYSQKTGLNASSLFWEFQSNKLDNTQDVSKIPGFIVDERTLGLLLYNASAADSGEYYCYIDPESPVLIDYTTVILGDPPEPVTSIWCVSDRFLDMTCNWCPVKDVGFVGWTLQFKINPWDSEAECPHYGLDQCSCHWKENDGTQSFLPEIYYYLSVYSSSVFWGIHTVHKFSTVIKTSDYSIVRPGPVEEMRVEVINSSSVTVSWRPDPDTEEIHDQGRILYTLEYMDEGEVKEVAVGTATSVILSSLSPYTKYEVKVRSKTSTSEKAEPYWSDWRAASNTTLAEAPSVGPALPVGAVKGYQCPSSELQCLEIFWQEVGLDDRNGPLGGYKLTIQTLDTTDEMWLTDAHIFSQLVRTPLGQPITVAVQAYTEEVVNDLHLLSPPSTVRLDRADKWLEAPVLVLETSGVEETGVVWRWTYSSQPHNFTLFMCQRHNLDGTKCQTSPVTLSVPGSSREQYIEGFDPQYVYAMAANHQAQTSGLLKTWVPLCRYDRVPGTPVISVSAPDERSLHVSWAPVQCTQDTPTGLVHNYTLYWTNHQESGNETVGAQVSEFTIPGLLPYTEYNVTMNAVSRAGPGEAAKPATVTTQESVPGDSPGEVVVSDVSSSSITVNWEPPQKPNGVITNYLLSAWGGTVNGSGESTGLSGLVENLDGYVNYSVEVVAVNGAGPSRPSHQVYALTMIRAPSQMSEVSVEVDDLDVYVEWAPPVPANGPIEGYFISVTTANDTDVESPLYRNESVGGEVRQHSLQFGDWCEEVGSQAQVTLLVQAFTLDERSHRLVGPVSEPHQAQICALRGGIPYWVWIIVGVGLPLIIFVIVLVFCLHKCRHEHNKKIPIVLPEDVGFEEKYRHLGEDKQTKMGYTNNVIKDSNGIDPDSGIENTSESESTDSSRTNDSGVGQFQRLDELPRLQPTAYSNDLTSSVEPGYTKATPESSSSSGDSYGEDSSSSAPDDGDSQQKINSQDFVVPNVAVTSFIARDPAASVNQMRYSQDTESSSGFTDRNSNIASYSKAIADSTSANSPIVFTGEYPIDTSISGIASSVISERPSAGSLIYSDCSESGCDSYSKVVAEKHSDDEESDIGNSGGHSSIGSYSQVKPLIDTEDAQAREVDDSEGNNPLHARLDRPGEASSLQSGSCGSDCIDSYVKVVTEDSREKPTNIKIGSVVVEPSMNMDEEDRIVFDSVSANSSQASSSSNISNRGESYGDSCQSFDNSISSFCVEDDYIATTKFIGFNDSGGIVSASLCYLDSDPDPRYQRNSDLDSGPDTRYQGNSDLDSEQRETSLSNGQN